MAIIILLGITFVVSFIYFMSVEIVNASKRRKLAKAEYMQEVFAKREEQKKIDLAANDKEYFLNKEAEALHELIKLLDIAYLDARTEKEKAAILGKQATALKRLNLVNQSLYKLWCDA